MRVMFLPSQGKAVLWLALLAGWTTPVLAHASERGQIMLLSTQFYIVGGALAVLASALVAAVAPQWRVLTPVEWRIGVVAWVCRAASLLSFLGLAALVVAGLHGPPDPISNVLPRVIWIWWWVGFTLTCMVFGNLWPLLNPWTGLAGWWQPLLKYPDGFRQWPAFAMFTGFILFELVYVTPQDPGRLAMVILGILLINATGAALFGAAAWLEKADCFSVFFRMAGSLSPLQWRFEHNTLCLRLGLPGHGLGDARIETPFILLALSAVSFDGLSRTFFWVGFLGLNPLEFPGRSAVIPANVIGLACIFAALAAAYRLAADRSAPGLAMSVVPIAMAYHVAHYLPEIWPGTLMDFHVARLVYQVQTGIVVLGHIMAVFAGHRLALRRAGQIPLNLLMVIYTFFGLWLLSTPVIS